jgi:5-methylcytosine-specific restriction endonuclease McrA
MVKPGILVRDMSSLQLLDATHELVRKARRLEAELLIHLAEIDERKLYLERPFPSMFAFCCDELGFSEDAAYSRILVARAGRRLPAVIEALRSGEVHLAGLRLLVPHLTSENHRQVLAQAARKSKREIEELVACLAPRPPVASLIRRLPEPLAAQEPFMTAPSASVGMGATAMPTSASADVATGSTTQQPRPAADRPVVAPLSAETFKIQFTAGRSFRDKLRQAQDLLRHRVPDGDMATILEMALDLLVDWTRKERFAAGRKGRKSKDEESPSSSRHIPDAIKRAVYERDGGRCTFTDEQGRRCSETGMLEFDHVDGFARTGRHEVDGLRLLCRAHNQYAAEQMYGRAFMEKARAGRKAPSTCPGTSCEPDTSAARLQVTDPASGGPAPPP